MVLLLRGIRKLAFSAERMSILSARPARWFHAIRRVMIRELNGLSALDQKAGLRFIANTVHDSREAEAFPFLLSIHMAP